MMERANRRYLAGVGLVMGLVGSLWIVNLLPAHGQAPAGLAVPQSPAWLQPAGASGAMTSPTATASPTAMLTPTLTVTVTATAPVSPTIRPTEAPATLTPTPGPTATPHPVHLPVALWDETCTPVEHYADVVFVVDVSNYMNVLKNGRPARDVARDMMHAYVDLMDLDRAKVGVVTFTDQIRVPIALSGNRALVHAAIDQEPDRIKDKARMDLALRTARDQLHSRAATPRNGRVIIFISELQAKGVPWEGVPGCVEKRGEECAVLAAAEEVKGGSRPVTIYLWATGKSNDGGEMLYHSLASDHGKRYVLPTAEEIAKVHGEIAVNVPCPRERFWPYPGRPHARPGASRDDGP